MLSLLLVNFFNEGGANTPMENLKFRGRWVSLTYYTSQVLLMLGYLSFQRFGWITVLIIIVLVATLRSLSSGVAILTIAMVMGREMVMRPGTRPWCFTGLAQINKIDMSTPQLLAETDAKMIQELNTLAYFKYIFLTVFGKGFGDRIKKE